MAVRTQSEFKALYGSSGTVFPDNTTEEISESDVRSFGEDIADTFQINAGIKSGTASGTDTYTVSISGVASYAFGDSYSIKFTNANTGASTININSLGAKSLKRQISTDLSSGDIGAGQVYVIVYDGTNFQVTGLSVAPTASISDTAFSSSWNGDTTVAPSKNTVYDTVAGLQTIIVNIGDWNMDTTLNVDVTTGIANHKNIRSISVIIRDDSDNDYDDLNTCGQDTTGAKQGWVEIVRSNLLTTQIRLRRLTGGYFDNVRYDSTSYNRGWITIQYVA